MEENDNDWLNGDIDKIENWFKTPDEDFHHLLKQHSESKILCPTRNLLMEYDLGNLNTKQLEVRINFGFTEDQEGSLPMPYIFSDFRKFYIFLGVRKKYRDVFFVFFFALGGFWVLKKF